MTAPDPTMDLIDSLERDPSAWVRVVNVPVCRPHKLPQGQGGKVITVTEADLPRIAAEVNAMYRDEGVPIIARVGHINQEPNFPEKDQPRLVGFGKDAKVGRFGPGQIPAVLVDLYVRREERDVLTHYPFRSMEFNPATGRISGLALLTRNPALDLGAIHYQAGHWLVHYEGKKMAGENGEDWTAEDDVQYAAFCTDVKKYAKAGKYMKKYQAEPGPTNTGTPALNTGEPPVEYRKLQETILYQAVERKLDALGYEGVQFDRKVELPKIIAMKDDAERDGHIAYMKTHYAKLPVGGMIPIADRAPSDRKTALDAPMKQDEFRRAQNYQATGKAATWEQARAMVIAERK